MITAALTIVLAQTCASVLPKPHIEIEWLRNGRAYARDVPIESSRTTRTYRRTPNDGGAKSVRTLSCSNGTGGVVLTESVNSVRRVRLPLGLKTGQTRTFDGVLVRRVRPPSNAATNAFWFLVTADAARIYGVREGVGIVEMRMQSTSGTVDVYRAFARAATPKPVPSRVLDPDMEEELSRLQEENRALQDTIAELKLELSHLRNGVGRTERELVDSVPPPQPIQFGAIDSFVRQGNYPAAIALLERTRRELADYNRATASVHPATAFVTERLDEVVRACLRANTDQPSVCSIR